MSGFTHFDAQGNAIMVDVTDKDITERCATASGCIRVSRDVFDAVKDGTAKKGDVLGTIRTYRRGDGGTDRGECGTAYHL